jgi:hypothetical protein
MKKSSLSLLAAGVMAVAGMAHADAVFYPDGTVVELGATGADNLALDSAMRMNDTTVLGAGPSTTTTVVTTTPLQYVYVQPNINWDRTTAMTQLHSNRHLHHGVTHRERTQAAATFNVPARAGEASTMTGGAPNMVTDNNSMVVGSYSLPYSDIGSGPYYVFSY